MELEWSGKANRVPVTIRQRNADAVLVEADLAPGDRVVTEGVQSLRPGSDVRIVEPQAALFPSQPTARKHPSDA